MSRPGGRDPLLKHFVGKTACADIPAGDGGAPLKLCVVGGRYGFSGFLHGRNGGKLPVSTGDARTLRQALDNARRQILGAQTRRN